MSGSGALTVHGLQVPADPATGSVRPTRHEHPHHEHDGRQRAQAPRFAPLDVARGGGADETVTWRARHFGITWTMTTTISELDRPTRFVDCQLRGPFKEFIHEHTFVPVDGGTHVTDRARSARSSGGAVGAEALHPQAHRHPQRVHDRRGGRAESVNIADSSSPVRASPMRECALCRVGVDGRHGRFRVRM